jgi:hypothetical protein
MDETITEAWERMQDYIAACPHHGMEEWFIIQIFYHGLIRLAWEHIDVVAGGSFFTLNIEAAHKLVEKMASNQSWNEEHTQTHTRKVHQLEEVDMLTAKIDLLMKNLENPGLDHLKMVDARVTCEECRETCHMGINCLTVPEDVNFVGNSNNGFSPNQGFNARWSKPSFPFDNPVRINDEDGKKIHATDKLLENINAKMDNFIVATQNQLSFNKMLETQIQQISAAIPSQCNGGSSKTPIQESVRSIFTVSKEKALKSTQGSLRGVGRDKKPSAVKKFSTKSSRRVKNAMPAVTSSPVAPVT